MTRRPLVLQLHKTEAGATEYAEFLHHPKRRFTDFGMLLQFRLLFHEKRFSISVVSSFEFDNLLLNCLTAAVRIEIQDETDRITGKSKQISPVPIHLSIYSPNGKALVFP